MAGTPDEETLAAAEAAHLALRESVKPGLSEPEGSRRPLRQAARAAVRQRPENAVPWPRAGIAVIVNALIAALTAVLPMAALVVLAVLTAHGNPTATTTARFSLAGWLLSLGVPLATSFGSVSLAPLALTWFACWRIMRGGVNTTRALRAHGSRDPRRALLAGALFGVAYAVLAGIAGWFVDSDPIGVAPRRAALHGFIIGFVFATLGAIRAADAIRVLARRVPRVVRDATRTGSVAALLMVAAGGAVTGLAVVLRASEASSSLTAYPGIAGHAGATLVSLVLAPDMAVWGAAYLLGPGITFGPDTLIRASGVAVGKLPALPAFVAMPDDALHGVANGLLGLPLVAGITAGWLLTRRRLRPRNGFVPAVRWSHLLTGSVLAGPVAGLLIAAACFAARGDLTGILSGAGQVGPAPVAVGVIATGVTALGCLIGALGTRPLYARETAGDPVEEPPAVTR
jgi:Family of unknown function (DUF6350)